MWLKIINSVWLSCLLSIKNLRSLEYLIGKNIRHCHVISFLDFSFPASTASHSMDVAVMISRAHFHHFDPAMVFSDAPLCIILYSCRVGLLKTTLLSAMKDRVYECLFSPENILSVCIITTMTVEESVRAFGDDEAYFGWWRPSRRHHGFANCTRRCRTVQDVEDRW